MNCSEFDAVVNDHRLGGLATAEKAALAGHLEGCRRCADAWRSHETLAADRPASPREGLYAEALAAAVAAGPVHSASGLAGRRSRLATAALGLAAASVIAVGLGWILLSGQSAETPSAAPASEATADDSAESRRPAVLGDTPRREPAIPGLIAGIHYERLPVAAPTTGAAGRVEVCEFFMFGCIHCYQFEPALRAWLDSQTDGAIDFVRVPALFNDTARLHAQAFYTAEALGQADRLIAPFYAEIHERGNGLSTVPEIRALFVRLGIDGARFDATFDSATVRARLQQAAELNRLYRVSSTPSIGVAGRYRTDVSMTGSAEALFDAVDALVEAEVLSADCAGHDDACPVRPGARLQLPPPATRF